MAWIALLIAGLFEVAWAVGLKYTSGWTRLWPSLFTAATMAASLYFLSLALRALPLGTAYAVWTGIGAVGAFLVGISALGEAASPGRIIAASLIVSGLIVMKLAE